MRGFPFCSGVRREASADAMSRHPEVRAKRASKDQTGPAADRCGIVVAGRVAALHVFDAARLLRRHARDKRGHDKKSSHCKEPTGQAFSGTCARKRANAWQSLQQQTKRKPADGETSLATPRTRPQRRRSKRSKGTLATPFSVIIMRTAHAERFGIRAGLNRD